jgi:glycosyltransferase involved in cell wall biosynthesis
MCYGIPVIAPPEGGVTEMVKHYENGFLEDVRNRRSIMKHLVDLRDDKIFREKLSLHAEETAKKFSGMKMKREINEIVSAWNDSR